MHFQDNRLWPTVIMPLPGYHGNAPDFFHNHPFPNTDISSNQKNMVVLCSTVGRGYSYFYASFTEWPQHNRE